METIPLRIAVGMLLPGPTVTVCRFDVFGYPFDVAWPRDKAIALMLRLGVGLTSEFYAGAGYGVYADGDDGEGPYMFETITPDGTRLTTDECPSESTDLVRVTETYRRQVTSPHDFPTYLR